MVTLWADGWFYISAIGFIVSAVFFVFLLGQYRAAVEAEDRQEDEGRELESLPPLPKLVAPASEERQDLPQASAGAPTRTPRGFADYSEPEAEPEEDGAAVKTVVIPPATETAAEEVPAKVIPAPEENPESAKPSPAVSYMQNLEKEIADLKSSAAQQAAQGDMILKRLAELWEKIDQLPRAASAPQPASLPEEKKIPAPSHVEPPPAEAVAEEPKPARKGPVWPI